MCFCRVRRMFLGIYMGELYMLCRMLYYALTCVLIVVLLVLYTVDIYYQKLGGFALLQ